MTQSNNENVEDIIKRALSAKAYAKNRDNNRGSLDTNGIEFLDKLKEMNLDTLIEKEIRGFVGLILQFVEGPYHSEILPGEVNWLLPRILMFPPFKPSGLSPEEILSDITTFWTFRDINALSPKFIRIVRDSISKLPNDIYEWTRDNVRFISSREDSGAFSLRIGNPTDIEGYVFLCESLKYVTEEIQTKSVAHEIAHIKLGHTKPIFRNLSVEKVKKHEEEADKLTEEWLARARVEAVKDRIERDDTRGSKYD